MIKNLISRACLCIILTILINETNCHKHSDKPMILLVSFDGFRWDYLNTHNLTNFNKLKENGTHADFIYNSFSTVTFPNHWTLVTGLYEESHGVIQNFMYDPVLNKTFNYTDSASHTMEWFGQNKNVEPIWTTNQKAGDGRYSAAEWVGANIVFQNQSIAYIPFNASKPYRELIDEFIGLFTNGTRPINFGALYFDEPDHTGHLYGPYSDQMKEKLLKLDADLGYLIDQMKSHHLYDKVNLIVTSDHGMDTISNKTVIFLDDYDNTNLYETYGSRACYSVFVHKESDIETVYNSLKVIPNVDVYKKNDIPESLRYKFNIRIGHMILVAKIGYAIYPKRIPIDWSLNNGDHGYYNNETTMYPIFIAHGPAFKNNYKVASFNNVDLYPLMCLILGVKPAFNNGSLSNVIDMLVYNPIEEGFSLIFVALLLIPICLITSTVFFICLTARGTANLRNNDYGYATVATSDSSVEVNNEFQNNDRSRLISSNVNNIR